ncbi:hypothetical protein OR1_03814 [Geobacter sp. OR-1]|nr:hypothetical protein OR1_03814 [Geobacter sp. OR-1]
MLLTIAIIGLLSMVALLFVTTSDMKPVRIRVSKRG